MKTTAKKVCYIHYAYQTEKYCAEYAYKMCVCPAVFLLLLYHIPLMYFQNSGPAVWLWVGMEVDLEQDSCQQQGVTGFGKQGGEKRCVCLHTYFILCCGWWGGENGCVDTTKRKKTQTSQSFVIKQHAINDHCWEQENSWTQHFTEVSNKPQILVRCVSTLFSNSVLW